MPRFSGTAYTEYNNFWRLNVITSSPYYLFGIFALLWIEHCWMTIMNHQQLTWFDDGQSPSSNSASPDFVAFCGEVNTIAEDPWPIRLVFLKVLVQAECVSTLMIGPHVPLQKLLRLLDQVLVELVILGTWNEGTDQNTQPELDRLLGYCRYWSVDRRQSGPTPRYRMASCQGLGLFLQGRQPQAGLFKLVPEWFLLEFLEGLLRCSSWLKVDYEVSLSHLNGRTAWSVGWCRMAMGWSQQNESRVVESAGVYQSMCNNAMSKACPSHLLYRDLNDICQISSTAHEWHLTLKLSSCQVPWTELAVLHLVCSLSGKSVKHSCIKWFTEVSQFRVLCILLWNQHNLWKSENYV